MLSKLAIFKPTMLLLNCDPCNFVELYKKIIFTNSTTNGSDTKSNSNGTIAIDAKIEPKTKTKSSTKQLTSKNSAFHGLDITGRKKILYMY